MLPARVEWPTVVVAGVMWGGFVAAVALHDRLPLAVVVLLLAVLAAWYGSLQHEVIHGHPTPWRAVNTALAVLPLGLAIPFGSYRDSHLAHHRTPELTDPLIDPESFHVTPDTWARCGPIRRGALRWLRTLSGRMVLGPFVVAGRCWLDLLRNVRTAAGLRRVLGHVVGVALVLAVVAAAGLSPWWYVVAAAWLGGGLSLVRSFVEHRATESGTRSAVVRSGPAMSLLFLNNNLHHTHHERPGAAWFRLPELHRQLDGDAAAAAGAGLYVGYGEVARRYFFRPFDDPVASAGPVATVTPTASPPPDASSAAATPQPAPAV